MTTAPRLPTRVSRPDLGRVLGMAAVLVVGARWACAGTGPDVAARPIGKSRALIVVGIPGDAEHEARFAEVVRRWRAWLTGPLGFVPADVRVLGGPADAMSGGPATREAVGREVAGLCRAAGPDDRVWVFWLGHADHDGDHLRLHLPGPDLTDDEFAAPFRGLACREQVFWMTSAGSGWMVRPLAARGRIVIAATERDREFNETEFPRALATLSAGPLAKLDADRDGRVSILEIYRATVAEVAARFASDRRIPTEHAQLDDDGDGSGTESPDPKTPDGALAGRTFVATRSTAENAEKR